MIKEITIDLSESYSCTSNKRNNFEIRRINNYMRQAFKNEYHPYEVKGPSLCNQVLLTSFSKDCMSMKANLDNYDEFINLEEHIYNV